jgi:hypothetical protein
LAHSDVAHKDFDEYLQTSLLAATEIAHSCLEDASDYLDRPIHEPTAKLSFVFSIDAENASSTS